MLQTTTWTPDTCAQPACVIQYSWDDALPAEARIHTPVHTVRHCAFHQGMELDAHWANLLDVNPRKNKALAAIIAAVPGVGHDDLQWSYDASHLLTVSSKKLDGQERLKTFLQQALDREHGPGKVKLL